MEHFCNFYGCQTSKKKKSHRRMQLNKRWSVFLLGYLSLVVIGIVFVLCTVTIQRLGLQDDIAATQQQQHPSILLETSITAVTNQTEKYCPEPQQTTRKQNKYVH
jgi:heme/copper-type cytochrome/quinol oxidase subunit 2